MNDCIDTVKRTFYETKRTLNISDKELEELFEDAKDVYGAAKQRALETGDDPNKVFDGEITKLFQDRLSRGLEKKRLVLEKIRIVRDLDNEIADAATRGGANFRHGPYIESILTGQHGAYRTNDSVMLRQQAAKNHLAGVFDDALNNLGVRDIFRAGAFNEQHMWIAKRAIDEGVNVPTGLDANSVKIAQALKSLHTEALSKFDLHGIRVAETPGFVTNRRYEEGPLSVMGEDRFVELMMGKIDKAAMREKMPWLNSDERFVNFFKIQWEGTVNGRFDDFTPAEIKLRVKNGVETITSVKAPSAKGTGTGSRNYQNKYSKERLVIFKDAASEYEVMKAVNGESLQTQVMHYIENVGNDLGEVSRLGVNPIQTITLLARKHLEAATRAGDHHGVKALNGIIDGRGAAIRAVLLRDVNAHGKVAERIRNATQAVQAYQVTTKLGGLITSQFGEMANMMAELSYRNGNGLGAFGATARGVVNAFSPDMQKLINIELVAAERTLQSMSYRVGMEGNGQGLMSGLASKLMQYSGVEFLTRAMRAGIYEKVNRGLAIRAASDFDKLHGSVQMQLVNAGIGKNEWNILRTHAIANDGYGDFIDVNKLDAVDAAALKAEIADKLGIDASKVTDRQVSRYVYNLQTRTRQYFNSSVYTAVNEPTAYDRLLMTGGTQSGTIFGSLVRLMTQFLSFPVSHMRKTFQRELFGRHGATGWGDGKAWGKFAMSHHTWMILLQTTMMGYMVNSLSSLAKGQMPPDPADPESWVDGLQRGGFGGLVTDSIIKVMRDDSYGKASSVSQIIGGPTVSDALKFIDISQKWTANPSSKNNTELVNYLYRHVPFNNAIIIGPMVNYYMVSQINEMFNPGYQDRVRKRAEANGNPYWIPPAN